MSVILPKERRQYQFYDSLRLGFLIDMLLNPTYLEKDANDFGFVIYQYIINISIKEYISPRSGLIVWESVS